MIPSYNGSSRIKVEKKRTYTEAIEIRSNWEKVLLQTPKKRNVIVQYYSRTDVETNLIQHFHCNFEKAWLLPQSREALLTQNTGLSSMKSREREGE